jgi:RIO kinase 1
MNIEIINSAIIELRDSFPDLSLVSSLKTGKEADVYIVQANAELLALKIYRENTKFSSRLEYLNTNLLKSRTKRAIMNHTQKGSQMTQGIWTSNEFSSMQRLYDGGAFIPRPLAMTNNSILMEYIGDEDSPAPRLADVKLTQKEAYEVFDKILVNLDVFLRNNLVHGDLSEYNILLWNSNPVIIDFPQMLILGNNQNAYKMLTKDITNMYNFFSKYLDKRVVDELNHFLY